MKNARALNLYSLEQIAMNPKAWCQQDLRWRIGNVVEIHDVPNAVGWMEQQMPLASFRREGAASGEAEVRRPAKQQRQPHMVDEDVSDMQGQGNLYAANF